MPVPDTDKYIVVNVKQAGPQRTEKLMGRDFRVFPAVMVQEQVLHNNLGRTYLPASAITQQWADTWNGAPVVVDHPTSRGIAVSARTPDVLNARGAGFLFRSRVEAAQLKADVYLDPSRAENVEGLTTILQRLDSGETVELSTGFPVAIEVTPGAFNGHEYDVILTPGGFDHLAIFADQTGACSIKDGCGLGVNHAGPCDNAEPPEVATPTFWERIEQLFARFKPTEPSVPAANAGDPSQKGDTSMDRKAIIAQLVANGTLDEAALNKLNDCQLQALANAGKPAPTPEPTGDGWDVARKYRAELETLQAQTANAIALEQQDRTKMLDDLLYNVRSLPWSEAEIKAMSFVELKKMHQFAFPRQENYAGRGGPRVNNGGGDFSFVTNVLDGPAGSSILDARKEN